MVSDQSVYIAKLFEIAQHSTGGHAGQVDDRHAPHAGVFAGRHADRIKEVQGTVRRQGGAVGHEDTVQIGLVDPRGYPPSEFHQVDVGETFRGDLQYLLTAHIGSVVQIRQAGQSFVFIHLAAAWVALLSANATASALVPSVARIATLGFCNRRGGAMAAA